MNKLSIVMEKLSALDFVLIRRNSAVSLFSLRKLEENQDFSSLIQRVREEGGRLELGLLERKIWVLCA